MFVVLRLALRFEVTATGILDTVPEGKVKGMPDVNCPIIAIDLAVDRSNSETHQFNSNRRVVYRD